MTRKIYFVSGTRADYGLMQSTLRAIDTHPRLELGIIPTAMHFAPQAGNTVDIVKQDGHRIVDFVDSCMAADSTAAMARSIALTMLGIAQTFERERPDFVMLLGDRGESLAAACAAAMMDIAVVHIHCGDTSNGHVDNLTRFAISQYAHILMPATEESRQRLTNCGVPDERIFVVGAPGLDAIIQQDFPSEAELRVKLGLDQRPIIVVLYHPASSELDNVGAYAQQVMDAVSSFSGHQVVVLGANTDAGGRAILDIYQRHPSQFHFAPNLERPDFLALLNSAVTMVGNSSCGLIEAPSFGLPVVNIGQRQAGRQAPDNVIHVPQDGNEIENAIRRALFDNEFREAAKAIQNPYGDGRSGKRIARILADIECSPALLQKVY